jgi:hypothetical protein
MVTAVGYAYPCFSQEPGADRLRAGANGDDTIDAALHLLQKQEPQSKQGLSTHAPMVAEALCALGYASHAVEWVKNYRAPVLRLPAPSSRIVPQTWRRALGPKPKTASWEEANPRWADWKEYFVTELAESRWQDVLDRWLRRITGCNSALCRR